MEAIDKVMKKVPESFKGTEEEYHKYIARVRKEGINSDQEDKTDWEELVDAVAQMQIEEEYEQWLKK